ncbi:MAG: hypothetical protein ACE365_06675, partial [Gammaproteobacteria bacterium]
DDYSGGYRMSARRIMSMDQAREMYARAIAVHLHAHQVGPDTLTRIEAALLPFCDGTCPVSVVYHNEKAKGKIQLGDKWRVKPHDELLNRLKAVVGSDAVQVGY